MQYFFYNMIINILFRLIHTVRVRLWETSAVLLFYSLLSYQMGWTLRYVPDNYMRRIIKIALKALYICLLILATALTGLFRRKPAHKKSYYTTEHKVWHDPTVPLSMSHKLTKSTSKCFAMNVLRRFILSLSVVCDSLEA